MTSPEPADCKPAALSDILTVALSFGEASALADALRERQATTMERPHSDDSARAPRPVKEGSITIGSRILAPLSASFPSHASAASHYLSTSPPSSQSFSSSSPSSQSSSPSSSNSSSSNSSSSNSSSSNSSPSSSNSSSSSSQPSSPSSTAAASSSMSSPLTEPAVQGLSTERSTSVNSSPALVDSTQPSLVPLIDYIAIVGIRNRVGPFQPSAKQKQRWDQLNGFDQLQNERFVPEVLIRTPWQDCAEAPFNPMISSFCFPRGLAISQWPLPQFSHSFVLTSVQGVRSYGFVYAQSERVPDRTVKALRALVARAAAKAKLLQSRTRRAQQVAQSSGRSSEPSSAAGPSSDDATPSSGGGGHSRNSSSSSSSGSSMTDSSSSAVKFAAPSSAASEHQDGGRREGALVKPSRSLRRMMTEAGPGSLIEENIGALEKRFFPSTLYTYRAIAIVTRACNVEQELMALLLAVCHETSGNLSAQHVLNVWRYLQPHMGGELLRFAVRLKSNIEIDFDRSPFDLVPRVSVTPALLKSCTPALLIHVFTFALNEAKLIFVSADVQYLCTFVTSVVGLLYPFDWPHLYAPLLPLNLLDFFDAPMPYIVGVCREALAQKAAPDDAIVIDLDNATLAGRLTAIVPLPALVADRMYTALSNAASPLQFKSDALPRVTASLPPPQPYSHIFWPLPTAASSAELLPPRRHAADTVTQIVECWTLLMGSFRPFLKMPRSATTFDALFALDDFLQFVPPSYRRFFDMFAATQIFQQLVQTRTADFLQGEPPDLFDTRTAAIAERVAADVQALALVPLRHKAVCISKRRRGGHRCRRAYLVAEQHELRKSSKSFDDAAAKKPCFIFDDTARAVEVRAEDTFYRKLKGLPDEFFALRLYNAVAAIDLCFDNSDVHAGVLRCLQARTVAKDCLLFANTHTDKTRFRRVRSTTELPTHNAQAVAFSSDVLDSSLVSAARHSYSSDELIDGSAADDPATAPRKSSRRRLSWTGTKTDDQPVDGVLDEDNLGLDALSPQEAVKYFGRTRCFSVV